MIHQGHESVTGGSPAAAATLGSLKSSAAIESLESAWQLRTYKRFPISIARGLGTRVWDVEGREYLDMYGGHAVATTGHCHPHVCRALHSQVDQLLFYSNMVSLEVRARAAQMLVEASPEGLTKVFFVNSGAEATENAVKLARLVTGRNELVTFEGGFHGRTLMALSAGGLPKYREHARPAALCHTILPFGDLDAVRARLAEGDVAAVFLEPIQSLAGVRMAAPEHYVGLRELCDRFGTLLIYDELQTGMGRTGHMNFAPLFGVVPDMITLGKGMASGVPIAAVLTSDQVAEKVSWGDLGTTFGGGPLAAAGLVATLEVIQSERLLENVQTQSAWLFDELRTVDGVTAVHGLGFLVGIRFAGGAKKWQEELLKRRIITGLSDDPEVLRLLPPLTVNRTDLEWFVDELKSIGRGEFLN
jgi:acetylornithine/succinyldiaminopimelate/putrescine aminotransferase